ncbi:TKL protein kinase [Saprolegnia parasitica CBS 223.65]|uniref:TKL protein kinase n=1 Tax=Saprolegnia parasitica (strain CBS 223.65) TaxID=695850 RepID=A0A067CSK1_SAPPC|nr:TKL protein kinase [Saprolegnia parasitica CBS 223.65]KDO33508.1 TKL protein kinase [Saprolegnia parasitica CBS 223.65]|eukprot:XP_012196251.1 TKL protein kinase [Saprolegnia parasitica CBS 223.65]
MPNETQATVAEAARPAYVYAERGPGCAPTMGVAATTLTARCPFACLLPAEANEPPSMGLSLVNKYFCIYTATGRILNAHNATADLSVVLQSQANGAYSTPPVLHLADVPPNVTALTLTNLGLESLGPTLVQDKIPDSPWSSNVLLRYMNLANNSIASVDGVAFPRNLHMLILAQNKLTSMDGIAAPRLSMLSVSRNPTLPPSAFTPTVARTLSTLRRLVADEMEWTEIPSSLPSSLTELSLAKNRLSQLSPRAWPPALRHLNAQYAGITTVYANFTPAMRVLCLGGNAVTAFYATSAQFELLSALPQRSASANALDASRCSEASPLLTTMTTNTSCTGHVTTRLLWDRYPVCILDTALDSLVTSPPSSSSGVTTALIVVSALLGVIAIGLLVLYLRFRRRPRPAPKWYEGMDLEMDTKGMLGMDTIALDPPSCTTTLPEAAIERQSILARGGFGIVYLATLQPTPTLPDVLSPTRVALKRLLPSHLSDLRCMDDFMDEIRFSARLRHDNIVRFYGFSYSTLADLAIVTEYMERGDLWQWLRVQKLNDTPLGWQLQKDATVPLRPYSPCILRSRSRPPAISKFSFLVDIVEGLLYLHTRQPPLVHRDLKAKNVLLSCDFVAKLTDFGVARETCDYTMTAEIGTVAWIAPEVLKGVYYTEKADVYSLGVLLSEMDTLEIPYADLDAIQTANGHWNVSAIKARIAMLVVSGEIRPSFSADVPRCIADVADRCLAYEPTARPTIRDVWAYCQQIQGASIYTEPASP